MSDKTILRVAHDADNPYLLVARSTARDKRLSYEALGLLTYLLSQHDEWQIIVETLYRDGAHRDKVHGMLKELQRYGYLTIRQTRDANGKVGPNEYIVHERPSTEKPLTVKPSTDTPLTANRTRSSNKPLVNTKGKDVPGEGASAPTPPTSPESAKRRTKLERATENPFVRAFVGAFPEGYRPPVTANMIDYAGPLEKAGYTPEQLAGLVKSKLEGPKPHYAYKMRYALEDMAGYLMAQARVRPMSSQTTPNRYSQPSDPALYRKPAPAKVTP